MEEPESCFGLAHMNLRHGQVLKTHTGPLPHDVWLFQLLWYDLSQTCAIHFASNAAPKVLRGLLRHNQRGRLRVQLSSIRWRQWSSDRLPVRAVLLDPIVPLRLYYLSNYFWYISTPISGLTFFRREGDRMLTDWRTFERQLCASD